MLDDRKWQALLQRDDRFDGAFVFAVTSTGIYCRPSCPSRRPKRENVRLFALPDAAKAAGFRACKRCRPDHHPSQNSGAALVQKICRFIEAHYDNGEDGQPTLAQIAAEVGGSPTHLQRQFKKLMGISPSDYADIVRLKRFKARMKAGDTVTEAIYEAGYGTSSSFYESAAVQLGMAPASYAKGGAKAKMFYAATETDLGLLVVAATDKGICFLCLGDDEPSLVAALHAEYPKADIRPDKEILQRWLADIVAWLKGQEPHHALPLDLRATAWQRRVWQELVRIPRGQVRTYSEIAEKLGNRNAQRAVARACATNPVSLLIPCHRVLREDGHLGGYRWGLSRKEQLIALERTQIEVSQTAA